MFEILLVAMRWLHIVSAALLVGGMWYARAAMFPALDALSPEDRLETAQRAATRFGRWAAAAIGALLLSGVFTIFIFPGRSPRYHMMLGIKVLLSLHVFAVAALVGSNRARRPARALTGAVVTGLVIVAIAAYLRRI